MAGIASPKLEAIATHWPTADLPLYSWEPDEK
jgi:hypothetical protein